MVTEQVCCQFMFDQLYHACDEHGTGAACPDVVVTRATFEGGEGELILVGRNTDYACNFCPACGAKWLGAKDANQGKKH